MTLPLLTARDVEADLVSGGKPAHRCNGPRVPTGIAVPQATCRRRPRTSRIASGRTPFTARIQKSINLAAPKRNRLSSVGSAVRQCADYPLVQAVAIDLCGLHAVSHDYDSIAKVRDVGCFIGDVDDGQAFVDALTNEAENPLA
jgi:hypothetical protein